MTLIVNDEEVRTGRIPNLVLEELINTEGRCHPQNP